MLTLQVYTLIAMQSFFYPCKHPEIILHDFKDTSEYFGLIFAKVYPPRNLFFPILPWRNDNGKLLFCLCKKCAQTNNQEGSCTHDDEERALTGVWCTIEYNLAIERGYRMAEIFEVWHFNEKSNTLFKDYIYTWLKQKQEASGFPPDVTDIESQLKYIEDYKINQGIQLEKDNIKANPAKRQIAKLLLNSLWGKMAQQTNQLTSKLVKKPEELFHFLFSNLYNISNFHFVNETTAFIQYRYNGELILPAGNVNVILAIFTTCLGRLQLFNELDKLNSRAFYFDTDSILFVSRPGDNYEPKLGNYLGELTSELAPGDYIVDWASAGAKTYCYKTHKGKVCVKAKGITQNYENAVRVNLDSVSEMVEGYIKQPSRPQTITAQYNKIVRNTKTFTLENKHREIRFKVVYDKRRLLADGSSLPFGY